MPKFVNVSGEDRIVGARADHPDAVEVKAGETYEVFGAVEELADAYLVHERRGDPRGDRLYPKSTWQLKKPAKADAGPDKKENA